MMTLDENKSDEAANSEQLARTGRQPAVSPEDIDIAEAVLVANSFTPIQRLQELQRTSGRRGKAGQEAQDEYDETMQRELRRLLDGDCTGAADGDVLEAAPWRCDALAMASTMDLVRLGRKHSRVVPAALHNLICQLLDEPGARVAISAAAALTIFQTTNKSLADCALKFVEDSGDFTVERDGRGSRIFARRVMAPVQAMACGRDLAIALGLDPARIYPTFAGDATSLEMQGGRACPYKRTRAHARTRAL